MAMNATEASADLAAAFADIVGRRRSVRGFKSNAVPRETLEALFTLAGRAPSNCNTQPWQVVVASGEACERLRRALPKALAAGEFAMDFEYSGQYQHAYRDRQYDAAAQLYQTMGIERADKVARNEAFARNFEFFGAPHVAFLFLPEPFGLREAADLGMFAQTLMLALSAQGLASCPQTALSFNADLVRRELDVDPAYRLLFGLSFGFEDDTQAANRCRVGRAPLDQFVRFVD
jgi:nitroreductase